MGNFEGRLHKRMVATLGYVVLKLLCGSKEEIKGFAFSQLTGRMQLI
jgi:hypothetical protein